MITEQQLNTIKTELNLNNLFIEIENHKPILYICLNNGVIRTFKIPKNENLINKNWVENKLIIINGYKNLSSLFNGLNLDYPIYYTTFGFSYSIINSLFSQKQKEKFNKDVEQIKNKLNSLNISFKNEFSGANWVYRFIISKSKDNLKIIKGLKND